MKHYLFIGVILPLFIGCTPPSPTLSTEERNKEMVRTYFNEVWMVMTGTQTGILLGIPPTGKRIEVNQINIEVIEQGRIKDHWQVTDELTLMKQISQVK